jgi:hypothetical protein
MGVDERGRKKKEKREVRKNKRGDTRKPEVKRDRRVEEKMREEES